MIWINLHASCWSWLFYLKQQSERDGTASQEEWTEATVSLEGISWKMRGSNSAETTVLDLILSRIKRESCCGGWQSPLDREVRATIVNVVVVVAAAAVAVAKM